VWARIYIRGTRFYDAHRDQWFAVFEPDTEESQYSSRRAAIVDQLKSLYSRDDVVKVKHIFCSHSSNKCVSAN
jgi:hypothetical protein